MVSLILKISFILAIFIWFLVAVGLDREIGAVLFMSCFYITAIAMTIRIIGIDYSYKPAFNGLKFCAIGFLIFSINFLVFFLKLNATIGTIVSWVGGSLMALGMVVFMFGFKGQ